MFHDRFQVDVRFSLNQLRECRWVSGMSMRGEGSNKAAQVVIPQVVGVVIGFSQRKPDFSQRRSNTSKMERLGISDDAIKIKDNSCQGGHRIDSSCGCD